MSIVFTLMLVVLVQLSDSCEEPQRHGHVVGKEIDYGWLARQAERHKGQVLDFLGQAAVQDKYRQLYQCLLDSLLKNITTYRRGKIGSTRRIVSGHNTSIAAVPWQLSLREKSYPVCGGSVLTELWALTAAHCLLRAKASDLSVRLGSSWKTHGGEMYDVKEKFVHPRYSSKTKVNDVGLLRLYSPLRFTALILPIPVVGRNRRLPADRLAIVSGWGRIKEGGPGTVYLQSTTVSTIAMKLCRRSGLDRRAIDPATMFCAGSFAHSAPDACQGDSGGPIVHEGVLVGVVSWGLGCARGNFPGVYTRLAHDRVWDWIHLHISQKIDNTTLTEHL